MKIGELEVNFEPFELPEDYKFVYKIQCCEHKLDFDTNTIVDKILSTRVKKVDEEIIKQLRNVGKSQGINELILIDESRVLEMIKSLKALEIIKNRTVDMHLLKVCKRYDEYNWHVCLNNRALTQEEFDLLKEELL